MGVSSCPPSMPEKQSLSSFSSLPRRRRNGRCESLKRNPAMPVCMQACSEGIPCLPLHHACLPRFLCNALQHHRPTPTPCPHYPPARPPAWIFILPTSKPPWFPIFFLCLLFLPLPPVLALPGLGAGYGQALRKQEESHGQQPCHAMKPAQPLSTGQR